MTLWEQEGGVAPRACPRRYTDALRRDDAAAARGIERADDCALPRAERGVRSLSTPQHTLEEEPRMYRIKLLVVANQTVDSDELYATLHERAERGPLSVTLLVPQDKQEGLGHRVNHALERLQPGDRGGGHARRRRPGLRGDRMLGPAPLGRGARLDAPTGTSRWLKIDLPQRIRRAVDAPVTVVESRPSNGTASSPITRLLNIRAVRSDVVVDRAKAAQRFRREGASLFQGSGGDLAMCPRPQMAAATCSGVF